MLWLHWSDLMVPGQRTFPPDPTVLGPRKEMKIFRKKCQALFKYFPKINPIILQYKISSTSHYIKNIYIFIFFVLCQIITLNSSNSHIRLPPFCYIPLSVMSSFFLSWTNISYKLSFSLRLFSLSFVQK